MNILKKIFELIKNIFIKKEEVMMIEESNVDNQREKFLESLRVNVFNEKKEVETHICYGDGLGIKKKLDY